MASEAPSWADQWGAGGIGAMEEEHDSPNKKDSKKKKAGNNGLAKVKGMATVGALKVKYGTAAGVKWIKTKCQKKGSPSSK